MAFVLLDDVVHTDYGQFDLVWGEGIGFDGEVEKFVRGQVNGLVGAADPGGVSINLARRTGTASGVGVARRRRTRCSRGRA